MQDSIHYMALKFLGTGNRAVPFYRFKTYGFVASYPNLYRLCWWGKYWNTKIPLYSQVKLLKLGSLGKRRQRKRHKTKGLLMSKSIAVHVRFKSLYISLPFSAKQQLEMTKAPSTIIRFQTKTELFCSVFKKILRPHLSFSYRFRPPTLQRRTHAQMN